VRTKVGEAQLRRWVRYQVKLGNQGVNPIQAIRQFVSFSCARMRQRTAALQGAGALPPMREAPWSAMALHRLASELRIGNKYAEGELLP